MAIDPRTLSAERGRRLEQGEDPYSDTRNEVDDRIRLWENRQMAIRMQIRRSSNNLLIHL